MTESMLTGATTGSFAATEGTERRPGVVRRLLREPTALVSIIFLVVVVLAAVLAPLLTPYNPTASNMADVLAAPFTAAHPLGTDGTGRDILANLLYGARTSLFSAAVVVVVSLVIGVPAGLVAGYYRGWVDGVGTWVSGALMALPAIVVLLVVLARIGRSTPLALAVFGVLIAPSVFLLIRSSVRAVREELYVDAAKVSGLRDRRIMRRHILPVVITPTIVQAAMLASAGIGIEAGIAFLGLGTANSASWGLMLSDAAANIYNAPWIMIWPSVALVLTVMAFTLLGNGLRDVLSEHGSLAAPKRAGRPSRANGARTATLAAKPLHFGGAATDAIVRVDNLRVAYAKADGSEAVVVDGVSLSVAKGEILGLVGESGSGKSQTAFSILGLLPAGAAMSADSLQFDGEDLLSLTPGQRNKIRGARIGYIPQEPMSNLDPSFRIGSQLTEPLRTHLKLSRGEAKAEALRLLARVGIADPQRVYRAYPHEISGGMAQRVLIAGAVSCNPDLLIADEPTTALDVTVQAEVLDLIRDLQAERGMAVILVTHNFGVVADLCDRVAVMRAGRIVEAAEVGELFASPRDSYTRTLLASTLEGGEGRAPLHVAAPTRDASELDQAGNSDE